MKILVACEESQAVTKELRKLGHEAYSCDVQDCSGGHPEWHIKSDALCLIDGDCDFKTMAGDNYAIDGEWDMIIAHPPCTYLTKGGAVRLFAGGSVNKERFEHGEEASKFFRRILDARCKRIAVENPVPMKIFNLPKYTQIIEPYFFGDPWRKKTCLWLKGLPPLFPTELVIPEGLWVGSTSKRRDPSVTDRYKLKTHRSSKQRSKTFPGIAQAMAEQWAGEAKS